MVTGSGDQSDPSREDGRYFPQSPKEAIVPETVSEPPKKKRESHPLLVVINGLLSLAIFGVILAGIGLYLGKQRFDARGPLEQDKTVLVERGATLGSIAARLENEGVITDALLFRAGVRAMRQENTLKAGEYAFPAGVSMAGVLEKIASGKSVQYQVTLPEGLTSFQIVERLRQEPLLVGEVAEIPAEGSLLPDTYAFTRGTDRAEIIRRMKASHDRILEQVWENRADDLPISTPDELVTLASIVEKETGQSDERGKVAGVFVNRLNQGIRLQSDPTIIYGITNGRGGLGRGIRRSEIDGYTPYNTYQIDGLPPTPIANPGRLSLEAVANPEETDALFFVADGTGGHAFSVTYEEHNRNVRRWREIEAERRRAAEEAAANDGDAATSN
ncbi:MAG: endolytic transglycosylase MltG [Pseudomonadota bacterium]